MKVSSDLVVSMEKKLDVKINNENSIKLCFYLGLISMAGKKGKDKDINLII